jgi:elongation factor Ts
MRDVIRGKIAQLGENVSIGGFVRIQSSEPLEAFQTYLHLGGKLGVIVQVGVGKSETRAHEGFQELARDLAMHVAAAAPDFLDRSIVPAEVMAREKDIYREQARNEGKPEAILDKIAEGKLAKYFKERCLLEQEFVKNTDETIAQLLERVAGELQDDVKVLRFERLKVGG